MFKVGDKVTWTSQAQGSTKTKTGSVVRILLSSEFVRGLNAYRVAINEFPGHKRMFDGYLIPGRSNVGYLVEVITGKNAKPRLYMPYPSKLMASKEG